MKQTAEKMGRQKTQAKPVMLYLSQELDAALDMEAQRQGESRSTIIRLALKAYVKQIEKEVA